MFGNFAVSLFYWFLTWFHIVFVLSVCMAFFLVQPVLCSEKHLGHCAAGDQSVKGCSALSRSPSCAFEALVI